MLAQLTRQVAVVQYPSLTRSHVRHIELVSLTGSRVLVVLITDTGRVEQRTVDFPVDVAPEIVAELRALINSTVAGLPFSSAAGAIELLVDNSRTELRPMLVTLSSVLLETMVEQPEERVMLAGTANLTRGSWDFPEAIYPVLEALEEQVVLLKLIGELGEPSALRVRIGEENHIEGLRSTSVVSTGYGSVNAVYAGLGVLGPTRMDYPSTIGAVRAVARYVGQMLAEN